MGKLRSETQKASRFFNCCVYCLTVYFSIACFGKSTCKKQITTVKIQEGILTRNCLWWKQGEHHRRFIFQCLCRSRCHLWGRASPHRRCPKILNSNPNTVMSFGAVLGMSVSLLFQVEANEYLWAESRLGTLKKTALLHILGLCGGMQWSHPP